MTAANLVERERVDDDPAPALVERVRRAVVGDGQVLAGPYGPRRITYADWAAPDPVPSLADLLEGRSDPGPGPDAGEDALADYLRQARELLAAAGPVTAEAGPSRLPPQLERLRDFHLPTTAWGGVPAR